MGKLLRILQTLVTALLVLLLASNLYVLAAQRLFHVSDPSVLGVRTAVVLTGSMEPSIRANDLVVVHRQASYSAGDVVMFRSGASTVTHRITQVTPEGYRTKGDANNTEDAGVTPPEDVLGRVVLTLHGVGAAVQFLKTPLGALCLVLLIPALVLLPEKIQKTPADDSSRVIGEDHDSGETAEKTE